VKQYWTQEKWVRVTDDERNIRWAGLNQPQTLADALMEMDQAQAVQIAQSMGLYEGDPRLMEVVGLKNDVSKLDVDIVLEEGPDIATLQIEQFETLAGLAKAGLPIDPASIIEASSLRNKDKILERMKTGGLDPNEPPPPPPPEAIEAQAKAKKAEAEAVRAEAEAMKAQIEAQAMASGAMPVPGMPAPAASAAPAPAPAAPERPAPAVGVMMTPELEQQIAGAQMQGLEAIQGLAATVQDMAGALGVGQQQLLVGQANTDAALADLARLVAAPTEVVRGPDGRVAGARRVMA
jgi:hypothetical protein